ncbi:MAG: hypothetical protein JKX76_02160 [Colwellia sp.]|nr:hypothetical protein [Colwellia sp.]
MNILKFNKGLEYHVTDTIEYIVLNFTIINGFDLELTIEQIRDTDWSYHHYVEFMDTSSGEIRSFGMTSICDIIFGSNFFDIMNWKINVLGNPGVNFKNDLINKPLVLYNMPSYITVDEMMCSNNIEGLEWAATIPSKLGGPCLPTYRAIDLAASCDSIDILNWAKNHDFFPTKNGMIYACQSSTLKTIEWGAKQKYFITKNGNRIEGPLLPSTKGLFYCISSENSRNLVDFFIRNKIIPPHP